MEVKSRQTVVEGCSSELQGREKLSTREKCVDGQTLSNFPSNRPDTTLVDDKTVY
jgi:hypothetical protein